MNSSLSFSDKQKEFIKGANHRWNFKIGATRSGKTYLDFLYVIPQRIRERTGQEGLNVILGVTQQTVERNVLEPMREIYGVELVGQIQKGTNKVYLFGDYAYVLGAEKINQVSKLQGASFKYVYGDETVRWNKEVFNMVKSRMDKPYSCFDGTGNPEEPSHWLKKFLDGDADIFLQNYTIDDNPYLPKEFVTNLKLEYANSVYYDRYILGKWALAEGRIYKALTKGNMISHSDWYARDENGYYTHPLRKQVMYVSIGVDFGGNKSAHAFVATAITKRYQHMITVKEKRITKEIDPEELNREFISFILEVREEYKIFDIRVDNAEQVLKRGFNTAMIRNKLPYIAKDAVKGPIIDRIRFYISMMNQLRYFIVDSCKDTKEAFETAVYKDDVLDDERLDDGTTNIDSLDAQEYSTEKMMKTFIEVGRLK